MPSTLQRACEGCVSKRRTPSPVGPTPWGSAAERGQRRSPSMNQPATWAAGGPRVEQSPAGNGAYASAGRLDRSVVAKERLNARILGPFLRSRSRPGGRAPPSMAWLRWFADWHAGLRW